MTKHLSLLSTAGGEGWGPSGSLKILKRERERSQIALICQKTPSGPSPPSRDKRARSDGGLSAVSVVDDSRIADLSLSKRWAMPGREGATITVTEAGE
jgi:hypothetical protein